MAMTDDKFVSPTADEYDEYYCKYISRVPSGEFLAIFTSQASMLNDMLGNLSVETESVLHDPYTWSLKQVLGHLIDCERIFSTRLLRIGVGDPAELPGIDHEVYVANLDYDNVTMGDLLSEFENLRNANILLAKRMSSECLSRRGVASDSPVSAKANLFILAGHVEYHAEIMRKRLGQTL